MFLNFDHCYRRDGFQVIRRKLRFSCNALFVLVSRRNVKRFQGRTEEMSQSSWLERESVFWVPQELQAARALLELWTNGSDHPRAHYVSTHRRNNPWKDHSISRNASSKTTGYERMRQKMMGCVRVWTAMRRTLPYLITQIVADELVLVEQPFATRHMQRESPCGKAGAKQKENGQHKRAHCIAFS